MAWEQTAQMPVGGEGVRDAQMAQVAETPFAPGMWVIKEDEAVSTVVQSNAKEPCGGPEWGLGVRNADAAWVGPYPGYEAPPSSVDNDFFALQASNSMPPLGGSLPPDPRARFEFCGDAPLDANEYTSEYDAPPMGVPLGIGPSCNPEDATMIQENEGDAAGGVPSSADGWTEAAAAAGWFWNWPPDANSGQGPPEWPENWSEACKSGVAGAGELSGQVGSEAWEAALANGLASGKSRLGKANRGANACRSHSFVPRKADLVDQFRQHREAGQKVTTLMIRNVPNRYTRGELIQEINGLGFEGTYDFLYLPVDTATRWNVGYAFVNFEEPDDAQRFMKLVDGHEFAHYRANRKKRLAQVATAHIQGLARNLTHLDGKSVFNMPHPDFRPWVKNMPDMFQLSDLGDQLLTEDDQRNQRAMWSQSLSYVAEQCYGLGDYNAAPICSFWELQHEAEKELLANMDSTVAEGNFSNGQWPPEIQDSLMTCVPPVGMMPPQPAGNANEVPGALLVPPYDMQPASEQTAQTRPPATSLDNASQADQHPHQQHEQQPYPDVIENFVLQQQQLQQQQQEEQVPPPPPPAQQQEQRQEQQQVSQLIQPAPEKTRVPGMEEPPPSKEKTSRSVKRAQKRAQKRQEELLKKQQESLCAEQLPAVDELQGFPDFCMEEFLEPQPASVSVSLSDDLGDLATAVCLQALPNTPPPEEQSMLLPVGSARLRPAELRGRGLAIRRFSTSVSERLEVFGTGRSMSSAGRATGFGTRRRRPTVKSFWRMDVTLPVVRIPRELVAHTAISVGAMAEATTAGVAGVVEGKPKLQTTTIAAPENQMIFGRTPPQQMKESTSPAEAKPSLSDGATSQAQVGGSSSSTRRASSTAPPSTKSAAQVTIQALSDMGEQHARARHESEELKLAAEKAAAELAAPALEASSGRQSVRIESSSWRRASSRPVGAERRSALPGLDQLFEASAWPARELPRRSMTRSPTRALHGQAPRSSWAPLLGHQRFSARDFSPDVRQPHWDVQSPHRARSLQPAAARNASKLGRRSAKSARRQRHTGDSSGILSSTTSELMGGCGVPHNGWQGYEAGSYENMAYEAAAWPPPPPHMCGGEHEEWRSDWPGSTTDDGNPPGPSTVTHVSQYDLRLCYMVPQLPSPQQCWTGPSAASGSMQAGAWGQQMGCGSTGRAPGEWNGISAEPIDTRKSKVAEQNFSLDTICGVWIDDHGSVYEVIKDTHKDASASETEPQAEEVRSCTVIALCKDGRRVYTERLIRDQTQENTQTGRTERLVSFGLSYLLSWDNFNADRLQWTPKPGSSGKEFFWSRQKTIGTIAGRNAAEALLGASIAEARVCFPKAAEAAALCMEAASERLSEQFKADAIETADCEATTLMVRCLPNDFSQDTFLAELTFLGLNGTFDFVYLPTEQASQVNIGCAFMNFKTVEDYSSAAKLLAGHEWQHCAQGAAGRLNRRKAEVSVAIIQGLHDNVLHYCVTMLHDNGVAVGPPPLVFLPGGQVVQVNWDLVDPNSGAVTLPQWHASPTAAMQDWIHIPAGTVSWATDGGETEHLIPGVTKQERFSVNARPFWELQQEAEKEHALAANGGTAHSENAEPAQRTGRSSRCASRTPSPPMQMQSMQFQSMGGALDWQQMTYPGQEFQGAPADLALEAPPPSALAAAASVLGESELHEVQGTDERISTGTRTSMPRTPSPPMPVQEFWQVPGFTAVSAVSALAAPTTLVPPPPPPPPLLASLRSVPDPPPPPPAPPQDSPGQDKLGVRSGNAGKAATSGGKGFLVDRRGNNDGVKKKNEANKTRKAQADRKRSPSPPSQPPLGLEWPTLGKQPSGRTRTTSRERPPETPAGSEGGNKRSAAVRHRSRQSR